MEFDSPHPDTKMIRTKIKSILNLFPEVRWDRYTEDGRELEFYGWIERPDGKFDFIDIFFINGEPEWYATSSAKLSKIFHRKLKIKWPHLTCKRVENLFPNNEVRTIKLGNK